MLFAPFFAVAVSSISTPAFSSFALTVYVSGVSFVCVTLIVAFAGRPLISSVCPSLRVVSTAVAITPSALVSIALSLPAPIYSHAQAYI